MTKAKSAAPDLRELTVVYRDPASLTDYENNSRTHSPEQIEKLRASIREFGFTNPILLKNDDTTIGAGHARNMAALAEGLDRVPTITLHGLSDAQWRAYVIADNQLALTGSGWDEDILRTEMEALVAMDFDMPLLGFDEDELAELLADKTEGLTDPDDVPEVPADPVSVLGDVWLLGKHRLACGDCTDVGAIDAALQGRKADLCLTDPPYGLDSKKKSGKNSYDQYEDTLDNLKELAALWLPLARSHSVAVVFSPGVTRQWVYPEPDWVICWFYGGGQLRSSWGFNCWQPFLCYGKDPSLANGKGARPDAIDMNTPANAGDINHPCPKPVKLWSWFLDRLTFSPNAVLFEPFSGSGTTIIAAEMKGIAVAAIELSPAYVDVAVKRWQDFTGKQAVHAETGQPFAQVARERGV